MFPGRPYAHNGVDVCVRRGKAERKMFIQSDSSISASHSFLPSLLYCSREVAGGNLWFFFRSNEMRRQKRGQDEVGEPFMAVSWSLL